MTRIVAGSAGGRRLVTPGGRGTRPTADRTREALFSAVEAAFGGLAGRSFLDLFAGSGAVGLEAASRGATPVVIVERAPAALAAIRTNAGDLGLPVDVRPEPVESFLAGRPRAAFDVVFVDPPYADPVDRVLALLVDGWLAPGAVVVVERATRSGELRWPAEIEADRSRRYGDTTLWYGRRP
jgi:16S rRNA (guanine966-N2)-methyltransferase